MHHHGLRPKGISVVLCCYNSAARLPETLAHLAAQQAEEIDWEIVLVDNASTDDTAQIGGKVWSSLGNIVPFRVVSELEPGLSVARRSGIASARYEYILFCDDDNWLATDYLLTAFALMEANPTIGVLGGQCEAVFETPPPTWFHIYQDNFSVGKQWAASGIINERGFVWGAGMIVRNSLLDLIYKNGFTSVLADRKGQALSSGGDNEVCLAILWTGHDLYFDERLQFKHYMTKGRLQWPYLRRLYRGFGQSHWPLDFYWYVEQRQQRSGFMPPHVYWRDTLKTLVKELAKDSLADYWSFFLGTTTNRRILQLELKIGKLQALLSSWPIYKLQIGQIERLSHNLQSQKTPS